MVTLCLCKLNAVVINSSSVLFKKIIVMKNLNLYGQKRPKSSGIRLNFNKTVNMNAKLDIPLRNVLVYLGIFH